MILKVLTVLLFTSILKQPLNSGHPATLYNRQLLRFQLYTNNTQRPWFSRHLSTLSARSFKHCCNHFPVALSTWMIVQPRPIVKPHCLERPWLSLVPKRMPGKVVLSRLVWAFTSRRWYASCKLLIVHEQISSCTQTHELNWIEIILSQRKKGLHKRTEPIISAPPNMVRVGGQ